MKLSGGLEEDGIVIGNTYNKYDSKNRIVQWLMNGFDHSLTDFLSKASPKTIHEVGCGEGYWVVKWNHERLKARGSDFSGQVIDLARKNAEESGLVQGLFKQRSIYDVEPEIDSADLIVCCEVLEHIKKPKEALQALQKIVQKHLIISVPREPIWRILNMARGKYILDLGNTPGHIQHWSRSKFIELVSKYFKVISVKSPLPWTMLLCSPKE